MLFIATPLGMNQSSFNVTGKVVHSHSVAYKYMTGGGVCGCGGGSQHVLLRKILGIVASITPPVFLTKCSILCSV